MAWHRQRTGTVLACGIALVAAAQAQLYAAEARDSGGLNPPDPVAQLPAEDHDLDGESLAFHAADAPPTRVLSKDGAARLRGLDGITLQWIRWDQRGSVSTMVDGRGVWRIYGEQLGPNYQSLVVEGAITEIGADYFEIEGAITIANAPDEGRSCEGYGPWRFAITQKRKYYRLRQFEWCDGLTDYIDIYF